MTVFRPAWGRGDGLGMTHAHDLYRALYPIVPLAPPWLRCWIPEVGDAPSRQLLPGAPQGTSQGREVPIFPFLWLLQKQTAH